MSQPVSQEKLQQLWAKTVEEVKNGAMILPLWEAVDACVPLTFEDPVLVLGIRPEEYHKSGHLKTPAHAHEIRRILERLTGKKVEYEVVEGDEPRHWELEKQRRAEREEALRRGLQRTQTEVAAGLSNWDDVGIELQTKFQRTKDRNLPWVQAEYMLEAFELILDLENSQRAEPGADHHVIDRGVARMLQKISGQLENLHIVVVGLEYLRFRQSRG